MKKIFFAVVALAAMSSCSKDQTVAEAPQQEIQFGNVFVDNATRVDYSNADALQGFTVYGTVTGTAGTVALFNGDGATVTRNNAAYNVAWTCSESEYWIPGAAYKFAAVVDATASVEGGLPTTLTTIADNDMNLKDMLYAEVSVEGTKVTATYDELVKFTFSHLLSKVKFTVTSNADGDYYHTVTGIKVSNFKTGTYTINGGTWAGTGSKAVEFAEIANVKSTDTKGKSNADMLLVPTTGSYTVTFTVNIYKGGELFGTETINKTVDTNLLKGNAYNFTIACSVGNPIEFSVTNDSTWAGDTGVTLQ
jgi:hypothetical protein